VAGALLGGADEESNWLLLGVTAEAAGLAFQIADDILDIEGTTEEIGKDAGSDQARGKATYPAVMGLGGCQAGSHRP
jgi:geranylgeranyl diphosphate synthase, type II